ncbi:M12 family metallo-peptidase [Methanohalophilus sp.]
MNIDLKFGISAILIAMLILSMTAMGQTTDNIDINSEIISIVNTEKTTLGFDDVLTNFETATVDPTVFLNDVGDGTVNLKLLEQEFNLELQEIYITSPDVKIILDDGYDKSILDAPKISTYKGKVVGEPNSSVILTVADDVVIGDIKFKDKTYFIEQTSQKQDSKVIHVIYSSDAIKDRKILEYNTDGIDTEATKTNFSTPSVYQSMQLSSALRSVPTVDIMACYDSEFESRFSNPTAEIQSIISSVDSNAFSSANVDLNIKAYKKYTSISNGNVTDVMADFKSTAATDRDHTNSDLAFLLTGKEMTGSWIGLAKTFTGSSNQAYAVGQMKSAGLFSSYQATATERKVLTAHELGHNFGATHDEAYSWGTITHYYTAMWSPFEGTSFPDYMQIEFSNLNDHGDSSHNNILNIVTNKGTVAGFQ